MEDTKKEIGDRGRKEVERKENEEILAQIGHQTHQMEVRWESYNQGQGKKRKDIGNEGEKSEKIEERG